MTATAEPSASVSATDESASDPPAAASSITGSSETCVSTTDALAEVCALTKDDLPEVVAIENVAYPRPWSERMLLREFENAVGIQRGWRVEGKLIGYVFAWILFDDLHINNVAVAPDVQRRGIGAKLMEAVFEEARMQGAKRVSLEVRPSNTAAKALYEKLGFRQIADRKGYYEDTGEDAIILARGL